MFIDTRSKNSMTQSICNLFNISEEDLMNKLDRIGDVTAIDDNYIERLDINHKDIEIVRLDQLNDSINHNLIYDLSY